ncbi:unnamed protein product [Brachionus calyciflorus]|uniref:C-type lectin domain-containing protein n=1 Tax=Brachionus calyciflorus TaxID=104777 RepID=A0A813Y4G0_9BILA|nr:unnamed protein product [Brachionus calyciflorus]
MNSLIKRVIICLGFLLNQILFTNSDLFSSAFMAKNYHILDNNSLLFKEFIKNKFFCLQACLMDIQCYYAKYDKNECSLFTIEAKIDPISLSDKKIYQKIINELLDEDIGMLPIQNLFLENCSNMDVYWSLTTNSCLPCKTGFMKYSEYPNICYHNVSEWKSFDESKTYCESKDAFLLRPKTKKERIFFAQKFPNLRAFVDSKITSVGKKYKWPDGSYVFGFSFWQPDNWQPFKPRRWWILWENFLEILSNGNFNDVSINHKNELTICQHN